LKRYNNMLFWLGLGIFLLAVILSYIFPIHSLGIVYFILIIIGITMLISSLVLEDFNEASEAKVGEGIGIIRAILGVFALAFAAFLMISIGRASLRLMEYNFGFLAVSLIWVLLIGLFLIGVAGILTYYNERKYKQDVTTRRQTANVLLELEYDVPNPDLNVDKIRFKAYDFGFSFQTLNAIFLKGEKIFTLASIEKVYYNDASGLNKRLTGYSSVFICKKGVDTYDFRIMPSDKMDGFKSYLVDNGINVIQK
jgi:hypothetical protein